MKNWDLCEGQHKTRIKALHRYKLLRNTVLLEMLCLSETMQISHEIDFTGIAASYPQSKTAGIY